MKYLSDTFATVRAQGPSPVTQNRIERCLILLKTFLEEFDERAKRRPALTPRETPVKHVKIAIKADKGFFSRQNCF
jgi:hypothetical protein